MAGRSTGCKVVAKTATSYTCNGYIEWGFDVLDRFWPARSRDWSGVGELAVMVDSGEGLLYSIVDTRVCRWRVGSQR